MFTQLLGFLPRPPLAPSLGQTRAVGPIALGLALCLAVAAPAWARVLVQPGAAFPDLDFPELLSPQDYPNLGLRQTKGAFRLSQVPGDLLVLEFFNKSCVPCQRQVRELEAFYRAVRTGPHKGRVRVLAIAAGNQAKYLPKYVRERGLTYPIAADERFDQWRRLGEPGRTPFTVFLVRQGPQWTLGSYHFGVQWEKEFSDHAQSLLDGKRPVAPPGVAPVESRPLVFPLTTQAVLAKAQALLSRAVGKAVEAAIVSLPGGRQVYQARAGGTLLPVYAVIASRQPVCEICHAVHFLFAFDAQGRVRGFEPIHVTKLNNDEWDPEENRFFESRLAGRPMENLSFDAETDAVTTATMSSALIFDEIRRTVNLLELVRKR